ncbi:hypothetical protein [Paenibacillus popilliae]|uniref:hypothetical protein n=1 Tax=Paenibacillus popilliae TaxID=78057 RepID=UPI00163B8418|nr:hypothetical protein [Paenibacillus sp. SDF0028]
MNRATTMHKPRTIYMAGIYALALPVLRYDKNGAPHVCIVGNLSLWLTRRITSS